jgi:hypothetical protein
MENMSFDNLDLLLVVIEIRMVLHILVHDIHFPCCIVTSSLTMWAFSYTLSFTLVVWNLFMCSLDYHSMYYNCSILHLASCAGEVCWDLFSWWAHWLFTLFSTSLLLWTWSLFIWYWSKRDKEVLCHALVTTHVCSVMVFVSLVDMIFSWIVLPLLWDELLWCSTFFLLWNITSEPSLFVDDKWFVLVIVDDHYRYLWQ